MAALLFKRMCLDISKRVMPVFLYGTLIAVEGSYKNKKLSAILTYSDGASSSVLARRTGFALGGFGLLPAVAVTESIDRAIREAKKKKSTINLFLMTREVLDIMESCLAPFFANFYKECCGKTLKVRNLGDHQQPAAGYLVCPVPCVG